MPCNYADYHKDWKSISRQIRDQADNRCEFCGVENHDQIVRDTANPENYRVIRDSDAHSLRMAGHKVVLIVLTVAHLDHDRSNNDPMNLRALCQRCHLRWDIVHHQRNARQTRANRLMERGQMQMSEVAS